MQKPNAFNKKVLPTWHILKARLSRILMEPVLVKLREEEEWMPGIISIEYRKTKTKMFITLMRRKGPITRSQWELKENQANCLKRGKAHVIKSEVVIGFSFECDWLTGLRGFTSFLDQSNSRKSHTITFSKEQPGFQGGKERPAPEEVSSEGPYLR